MSGEGMSAPCEAQSTPAPAHGPQRRTQHFYKASGALCVEITRARSKPGESGEPPWVLQVEAARRVVGTQAYDWGNKISIQLDVDENSLFVAACMGWIEQWQCDGHGAAHDKVLMLRNQRARVQAVLRQGGNAISVPIEASELARLTGWALRPLCANAPHLSSETVLRLCRRAVDLLALSPSAQANADA